MNAEHIIEAPCPICGEMVAVSMTIEAVIDHNGVVKNAMVVRLVPSVDYSAMHQHAEAGCATNPEKAGETNKTCPVCEGWGWVFDAKVPPTHAQIPPKCLACDGAGGAE